MLGVVCTTLLLAASAPLTLEDAVRYGLDHSPALQTQESLEASSRAAVDVARTRELPSLDAGLEVDWGSANIVTGPFFALPGVPNITGAPASNTGAGGALGTAASLSASWDALGLTARMASVDAALAESDHVRAGTEARRLEVAARIADLYLGVIERSEALRAAQANEKRAAVLVESTKPLVKSELKPGADLSRLEADHAAASTQIARANEALVQAKLALAEALGTPGEPVDVVEGHLLDVTAMSTTTKAGRDPAENANPFVREADAAVTAAQSRERALVFAYLPRLDAVASLWARGSGFSTVVKPGGSLAGGALPDTPNWVGGLVLTWPILDAFWNGARLDVAKADETTARARKREVEVAVQSQIERARAILEGAKAVAANTPIQLRAARVAEEQASARYQAGLANVTEVAEAERLLAQAEIDDADARLGVRSAQLLLARALGDLEPFFADIGADNGGK